ncbi:IS1167, transposase [Streptococcus pneumoniae]|nr:IS1167, transposase [Streptococcus pneumoniae]
MEQLHFITKLLDIKDPNIKILDIINMDTHKEIIAKLDYEAPSCPECGNQLKKYDFQKPSKIPYLETTGMPTRILLRKRRFKCYQCSKIAVAETSLVKKNHQIPRIINQKIAQKLIEKISMTDIAHQLFISTSTVIRKLNDFHFKHDFSCLPEIMSWDEYAFTKGKIASLRKILTISISSLFLRVEHKLSFEITFFATIELSDVASKLLLWICLVLTMTWLNSFAFKFLGSG